MNTQSKWVIGGALAAVLILGCILGAVAVTLIQHATWDYNRMSGSRFGDGPMMDQNYMGRGSYGPGGMMGRGDYGPGMMEQQGFGPGSMGRGGYGPGMMEQQGFGPGSMGRGGYGPMMGGAGNAQLSTVAEELDMTTADLLAELKSGKTVADLAQEKDVSLDKIVDSMMAPHIERMALMVANEAMSQEQVDAMLELMKVTLTTRLSSEWASGTSGFDACPDMEDTDGDGACDFSGRGPRGGRGPGMMWR